MVVEDPRQSPEGLSTLSAITLAAMGNSIWPILRMATVLNTSSPSSPSSCQPPTGRRCSGARRRMREGATWRHLRCALQKRARLWHTHRPLCRRCVEMRLAQDALNAARAKLAQQHAAYVPAAVHAKPSFAVNEAMCFAPPALRCAAGAQSARGGDVCRFVTINVISPRKRVGWLFPSANPLLPFWSHASALSAELVRGVRPHRDSRTGVFRTLTTLCT